MPALLAMNDRMKPRSTPTYNASAHRLRPAIMIGVIVLLGLVKPSRAQLPELRYGETVPRDVREMYDRGLQYLARTQTERGDWPASGQQGPGCTGLCLLSFLASGEDPNFGVYSNHLRRGLRNIISSQDATTGIMGQSMYHHGFALLALSEAYGALDERNLWGDQRAVRSIGQALELGVRAAVTSQKKNPLSAWRYSPNATDADTSVSGSVLVGLLAARNAGIEVPDESIDKAIAYYKQMTARSGDVAYSGGMGGFGDSLARSSIATLVYALAKRKDMTEYKSTLDYVRQRIEQAQSQMPDYTRYYQAQALFQGDFAAWEKWNRLLVRQLKGAQAADGSFRGQLGSEVSTSMALLALALNFRFLPIYER
jgi:hypothetical protein